MDEESGVTYIEVAIMFLIANIAVVAMALALRTATQGTIVSKERSRALALARDRLEDVKHLGYPALSSLVSNYYYPDNPAPGAPLEQATNAVPYPASPPLGGQDPWTPETVVQGRTTYWRHVVVKMVTESATQLLQDKPPCLSCSPVYPGGLNTQSNLAFIEVDVTWFSKRAGKMQQVRLSSLVANTSVSNVTIGTISGSIVNESNSALITTPLIVVARDDLTGLTYSVYSSGGLYSIGPLPFGTFFVTLTGAPSYLNSGYTGSAKGDYDAGYPDQPVVVSPAVSSVGGIHIYSRNAYFVQLRGKYMGVDGSSTPQTVVASVNDGSSSATTLVVTSLLTSSTPATFTIGNIAIPQTGSAQYSVFIENKTTPAVVAGTICVDSSVPPGSVYYIGWNGALPVGANPCLGGCSSGWGGTSCSRPDPTGLPWSVSLGGGYQKAFVHLNVQEYYNGKAQPLSNPGSVFVNMIGVTTGASVTLGVDSTGSTIFQDLPSGLGLVPVESANNVIFTAYTTATGFQFDKFSVPFDIGSGAQYELVPGGSYSPLPSNSNQQHQFYLIRVSAVGGTVWSVPGVSVLSNVTVNIQNATNSWNAASTTDSFGHFYFANVPEDIGDYTITVSSGTDLVSSPANMTVTVQSNGLYYWADKNGKGLEFTLTAVNGNISGTVFHGGKAVSSGAVVVASTYSTSAFPSTLPAAALLGQYTYSTVTQTDGTYAMKVATGVGSYHMYAFMATSGTTYSVANLGPVNVTAGITTNYGITIP